MTNMWEAATLDYERERLDGYIAAASVAVAEQHGFVIQASTRQEFDDRLALVTTAVERAIEDNVPAEFQLHAHHWLILHGRYICVARKPKCGICPIRDLCLYEDKTE